MDLDLEGKSFVVGGGSSGLGRAVAEALVGEGGRVLLVSRNEANVGAAAAELGPLAFACAADLATPNGVDRVGAAASTLGGPDGLLVNAGGPAPGNALDAADEEWERAFSLLLAGPIRLIRALVPTIRDGSAILFITSSSVRVPIRGLDTSNVIRPGVAALAKCLALELAPHIRVNSLAPGRLNTERIRFLAANVAAAAGIDASKQRDRSEVAIALGRYGDPAELDRVAAFLLSPAASYVTGTAVQIDGG